MARSAISVAVISSEMVAFSASSSAPLNQTISKVVSTTTVSATPPSPSASPLVTFTITVGPALNGAVTHPGGAAERACYADY